MNRKLFAAALVAALALTGQVRADETVETTSDSTTIVLKGHSRLAAVGFGQAKFTGPCWVHAAGIGKVEASAGVKYKSKNNRYTWKEVGSAGGDAAGWGWVKLRLNKGESATLTMSGRLRAGTRFGSDATVELKGRGKVRISHRFVVVKGNVKPSSEQIPLD